MNKKQLYAALLLSLFASASSAQSKALEFEVQAGSFKSNLSELASRMGYSKVIFQSDLACADWTVASSYWIKADSEVDLLKQLTQPYPVQVELHKPDKVAVVTQQGELPACRKGA